MTSGKAWHGTHEHGSLHCQTKQHHYHTIASSLWGGNHWGGHPGPVPPPRMEWMQRAAHSLLRESGDGVMPASQAIGGGVGATRVRQGRHDAQPYNSI